MAAAQLMPLRERAAAMVARVALEAGAVLNEQDAAAVRHAVEAALLRRDSAIADDHDPRYLQPGRVVRILLSDAGCRNPATLKAAAFVDSVDPELAAPAALLDGAAARLHAEVPLPDGQSEDLLERLVSAGTDAAVIALVERLDQARHLHLRPELPWLELHQQIREVYVPAACRIAPRIALRLERWADAFERRLTVRRLQT